MPCKTSVLVVANLTAASPELVSTLVAHADRGQAEFTLLVPASANAGGWDAARDRLQEAVTVLRVAGLRIEGRMGCGDPVLAVCDEWDPARYNEVILSTLPLHASDWAAAEVPERVERLTGARVTHIVSEFTMLNAETVPHLEEGAPAPHHGVLGPRLALSGAGRP